MELPGPPLSGEMTATPSHAFIVGSPRSGTTWLQLLLAQHPCVATSQETHIFLTYLGRTMRAWEYEATVQQDGRRKIGLTAIMQREEFEAACRAFTDTVFDLILDRHPGASIILEKTPDHAVWGKEILALYPDAAFIHLVRDPRDVVCSMRHAGRSWGRHWAPTNVLDAARLWRNRVEGGLEISRLTPRYLQIHYEELSGNPAAVLSKACGFLGLPTPGDFCEQAAEACRLDRLRRGEEEAPAQSPWGLGGEPDGFFRRGLSEGWRSELTRGELKRVEYAASPLMADLGYEPVGALHRRPPRVFLRESLEWLLNHVHDVCTRLLGRL